MSLKIGDKAPNFTGTIETGTSIKLSDFKGKKVVLYFYPKDNTPGCTAQACNLTDNYTLLQKQGYEIIGISSDSAASHQKFITKYQIPFHLIADTEKTIHELYGVWVEKSMYGRTYMGTARTTFVINEKGMIEEIISKVDTKNHTNQIIK
jgi:peroxiredoxin Q/BCP